MNLPTVPFPQPVRGGLSRTLAVPLFLSLVSLAGAQSEVARFEAVNMTLSGYTKDMFQGEECVKLTGPNGTAEAAYNGPEGAYDVRVRYLDALDDQGFLSLAVNGRRKDGWSLGRAYEIWTTRLIAGVVLKPGDRIKIVGSGAGKELARLNAVSISVPRVFKKLDEGINQLPPMGWCSWNFTLGDPKRLGNDPSGKPYDFNEEYCKKTADKLVERGLRDLGYKWMMIPNARNLRGTNGVLHTQWAYRYPNGFAPLVKYLHGKGLKALLYTDGGNSTCGPGGEQGGNYQHEQLDADTFIDWGADGLKMDWCGGEALRLVPHVQYQKFSQALLNAANRVGRPLQLEICVWGVDDPYRWGPDTGSFWRTGPDIANNWHSMTGNLEANRHPEAAGPDKGWNFPDMLMVGVPGGLSDTEERAHFGLWCIVAAPLQLGNDVVHDMSANTLDIIMNKEAIAVDQDPLGKQGDKVKFTGDDEAMKLASSSRPADRARAATLEVWSKPLQDGSRAVGLFNKTMTVAPITVAWSDIGLERGRKAKVRDLWKHQDLGEFTDSFKATVESHALVFVKITPLD